MKLPNSMVARVWGPFLLMAALLIWLVGLYTPAQQKKSLNAFQGAELQLISDAVAQSIELAGANNDFGSAQRYFELLRKRENIEFSAIQYAGDTLIVSNPVGISYAHVLGLEKHPLFVQTPFEAGAFQGRIFIKGSDVFVETELNKLNSPLYAGLMVMVIAVIILFLFLQFQVSSPLKQVLRTADNIRSGDLESPIHSDTRIHEIRSLNLALERLRKGLFEQRKTNKNLTSGMEREIQSRTQDLTKILDELQDSQNLFKSVIESALDAMIIADGESIIVEWNRKAEIIFGWTREEALGQRLSDLIIPHQYRNAHNTGMSHYHATGHGPVMNKAFEIQGLRKSGEVFDIELYITQVQIDNQIVFSSFIRDITIPKQLAEDLERERKLNTSLLNGLPMMVSLKDADLRFTFINDDACKVLGKGRDELIGKQEKEVFTTEWVQESIALDRAGYEGQNVPNVERTFTVEGKEENYLIGRHKFSIGEENITSYLLTYGFNVSQLKTIQSELEEALQAKDEFLATISHEIRTPLHSIIVLAELLNNENRIDDHEEFTANIRSSSRHLLELVNDLLDFAKAEAGKLSLAPEPVELQAYIDSINRIDQDQRKEEVHFFKTSQGCENIAVLADPTRLNQVLSNLLSNAFKFTDQGKVTLNIDATREKEHVLLQIKVTDTGIGIPKNQQGQILEAFQQAHTGIARQFGGTGLGLGIVVRILELMNSELHIESEPGIGSCFHFSLRLPLHQSLQNEDAGEDNAKETSLQGLRLLYVEDIVPNQLVMRAMSKPWDIELTIASTGQEAIELARTQTFDLIFMDIQMPVMDGIEAFQIIQELEGDCPPVHAFTAHTGKSDLDKYQNLGFKSVLTKPMAPKELKSTLKRHIDEQDRGRI